MEPSRPTRHRIATATATFCIAAHRAAGLYHKWRAQIDELDKRVGERALQRPGAKLLMTHPRVGPVTALATDVFLGDPARLEDGKALASYVGMIPSEYSSGGGQQRLGGLSKQGSPSCAFFGARHPYTRCAEIRSCNASTGTSWHRRDWLKREWPQLASSGFRLWIMLRDQIDYQEFCRRQMRQKNGGACAEMPEVGD